MDLSAPVFLQGNTVKKKFLPTVFRCRSPETIPFDEFVLDFRELGTLGRIKETCLESPRDLARRSFPFLLFFFL